MLFDWYRICELCSHFEIKFLNFYWFFELVLTANTAQNMVILSVTDCKPIKYISLEVVCSPRIRLSQCSHVPSPQYSLGRSPQYSCGPSILEDALVDFF